LTSDPPPLICCGNLTLDDVVLPDGTEQPCSVGGDALYGVLAARLFLPEAQMLAPVGHDLPPHVWALIDGAGLSRAGLPPRDCPTIHTRFVYQSADRRIVTLLSEEADFDVLSPRDADIPQAFRGARAWLVLAMTLSAQCALVAALRAAGAGLIGLDLQEEYIAGNESAILDLVRQVDVFMPSEAEVRLLLGHDDPLSACQTFAALGPRIVVIKRGAAGCFVYETATENAFAFPARDGKIADTTGAGDAFCAGFMAGLAVDRADLLKAASQGALAASLAVSGFGVAALAVRQGSPVL
jgi:sugar/nucleoside kinase (ribokinase family)